MNFCDSNVWFALTVSTHSHHESANRWFIGVGGARSVAFCRATQQALLRLVSTASIMGLYAVEAYTNRMAWELYRTICSDDRVTFLGEPTGLATIWERFASVGTASPKLWMDAYLAAFAQAAGARLVTFDKGFRQFAGVDVLVLA